MNDVMKKIDDHKYWILSGVILLALFFSFLQMDLIETSSNAYAMSEGHIFDFYSYHNVSYLPTTFFLFGIWNLPIRLFSSLFHHDIFSLGYWGVKAFSYFNKILPVLFYFGCAYLVYKIADNILVQKRLAKVISFAFLTTPIAVYSQFIFGQYDSLTLFFVLLGVYFLCKDDLWKFTLCFAVAITFKYLAAAIYFPLLLAKEKDIIKLIKHGVVLALPTIFEILLFPHPANMDAGVVNFAEDKLQYITGTIVKNPIFSIQIVVFLFVLLCAYAYFNDKIEKDTEIHWMFFYINVSLFLLFGISAWHPQWVLLAIPFWVISTYQSKNAEMFLFLDVIMMFFFIVFTVQNWQGSADQELLRMGIFGHLLRYHASYNTMADFIPSVLSKDLSFTVLSALMFLHVYYKHPKFREETALSEQKMMRLLFIRLVAGISVYLIPCICSVNSMLRSELTPVNTGNEYINYKAKIDETYNLAQMKNVSLLGKNLEISIFDVDQKKDTVEELFTSMTMQPSYLVLPIQNLVQSMDYRLTIKDMNDVIIYENSVKPNENELKFYIVEANLKQGKLYKFQISSEQDILTFYKTNYLMRDDQSYAMLNQQKQSFDIVFKLIQ